MSFNVSYVLSLKNRYSSKAAKITASTQKLNSSLGRLNRKLAISKASFGGATSEMAGFARGMIATLAAAAGFNSLVTFERQMAKVKAISGATGDEFVALREKARDLGATTEFTAGQAAAGMAFLAQAGFKTSEILASMTGILNLATAGSLDLAAAADITSNVMTPFGIKANEITRVVDAMAIVAANSNTNIIQLGGAMKNVAPVAAKFKISLEATAAAIGVLGDAGIQAERAGTGLKIIMLRLVKPVGEVKLALKALNVQGQELNPAVNSLSTVLGRMKTKLDNVKNPALRAAIEVALFGQEASAVGGILLQSGKRMAELRSEMKNTTGAAKRMADIMRNNLGGDIDSALSSVSNLVIGVGESGLTKALRDMIQGFTTGVRAISSFSQEFPALTSFILKAIAAFIGIKIAIMAYGKAQIAFLAIQVAATNAMLLFNLALAANPIGVIVGVMALAIAGFIAFREEIGQTVDSLLGFFNLPMPDFLKGVFGMDVNAEANIIAMKEKSKGLTDPNIAAKGAQAANGRIDGNININAPKGVIKSIESITSGTGINLGLNAAAAL